MGIIFLYLISAALLPLVYLFIILKMNKGHKKPKGLVWRMIFLSALGVIVTTMLNSGSIPTLLEKIGLTEGSLPNQMVYFLIIIPLIEEGVKFFVLSLNTWKHKSFTHSYDGIIFGVSAALGFTIFENIIYMVGNGLWVGLARGLAPIHIICGIFMGHYYMLAKRASLKNDKKNFRKNLFLSLSIPILIHGFHNFSLSYDNDILLGSFVVFYISLVVITVRSIRKYAKSNVQFN